MRGSRCAPSGRRLLVSALMILMLVVPGTVLGAMPQKVALFPFKMNASQNLDYLQNGMFSMLSSRLSDPGKLVILGRDTVDQALAKAASQGLVQSGLNESAAKKIAQSLGADYTIFGSITIIGESVSLDAALADVTGQKETLNFSDQSKVLGDVIALVNNFAVTANQNVFNRNVKNQIKPIARSGGAAGILAADANDSEPSPGLHAIESSGAGGFTALHNLDTVIRAMASGDLTNKGITQVVTATDNTLTIHHLQGSRLMVEQILEYPSYLNIVGLDIADINKNGYPEIFVSAMTIHQDSLASFVVEFNGSSYGVISEKQGMYYKVLGGSTQILLGQEKGADPFSGKIYLMEATRGGYLKDKRVPLPLGTSVLALDRGVVRSGEVAQFLSVNRHGRLVLASNTGGRAWESKYKYGGTNKVWLMEREDEDESYRERIYFNPRMECLPPVKDGDIQQVVLIKNDELLGGALGRYKRFEQGHLEILSWNGMAMTPVYKTTPVQGWISDFNVADLNNDGRPELIVAVVGQSKYAILGIDQSSTIISYELE